MRFPSTKYVSNLDQTIGAGSLWERRSGFMRTTMSWNAFAERIDGAVAEAPRLFEESSEGKIQINTQCWSVVAVLLQEGTAGKLS
jgi:hypothetical protein